MTSSVLAAHDIQVLAVAALGIAIIVVLIVWLKMHAFLALTVGALVVGVGSGIPLGKVTASYEAGVGGVLGCDRRDGLDLLLLRHGTPRRTDRRGSPATVRACVARARRAGCGFNDGTCRATLA